jgi:hypothetical protein
MLKKTIRFLIWLGTLRDHTYGRHAELLGNGPCGRCVGRAVTSPGECSSKGCDSITHNEMAHPS